MTARIQSDPNIVHGQPCVAGTRLPVSQVLGALAAGDSFEDLLADYPYLTRDDIRACLAYAARLAERPPRARAASSSLPQ